MKQQSPYARVNSLIMALIVTIFAALALYYALTARLGGGPDETSHFIYIRTLAQDHRMPEIAHESVHTLSSTATHEGHQPPLYYAAMALPYAALDGLGASVDGIWRTLRILGIIFGVIWLYSVRRLGALVFESERAGLAVAAFVALIPTASFMTGMIDNDILISMWFGWGMALIVGYLKRGSLSRRGSVALGLVIGAAILTKAQGLILIPLLILAALIVWRRRSPQSLRDVWNTIWPVLVVAFLAGGWWLVRSLIVHGSIQPESLSNPAIPGGLASVQGHWGELLVAVRSILTGTWGYFWTPYWIVQPFTDANTYLAVSATVTALPWVALALRAVRSRDLDWSIYGLLILAAATLVISWLRHTLFIDFGANLQGRLFLPIAPVISIVGLAGVAPLLTRRWSRLLGAALIYGGMLAANAFVVRCVAAYYALGIG